MRSAIIATVALLAATAAAAQPLRVAMPADANKDGVVTDEERADYYARQAEKRPTQEIGVAAPKAAGDAVTIKLTEPVDELDKRAVPASDFERAQDAQARKAQADKDD